MSQQTSTIQLIKKPKTSKDWENNKLYYRNKGFSKKQLEQLEKDNKAIENCVKIMTIRSRGGGCNAVDGGTCPNIKKKKKIIKKTENEQYVDAPAPATSEIDEIKTRILTLAETLRDEWGEDDEF